ncbi:MAG TPA: hypothetical protein VF618_19215 [Thermoanaerobaculia bacterium]
MKRRVSLAMLFVLTFAAALFAQEVPVAQEVPAARQEAPEPPAKPEGNPMGRLQVAPDAGRFTPSIEATYNYVVPMFEFGSAPGYLKLVTPVAPAEGNQFWVRIHGFLWNPGAGTPNGPFQVTCSGNAQVGIGLREPYCVTEGLEMPVQMGIEYTPEMASDRVVIAIGTSTTAWYNGVVAADYYGTVQKTQWFFWRKNATAISPAANYPGNKNYVFVDDPNGLVSVTQPAVTNSSRVPLYVASGLTTGNAITSSAFRATRSDLRGAVSATVVDRDNVRLGFDVDFIGNAWMARDATSAWLTKQGGHFRVEGVSGGTADQTAGTAVSLLDINLANGNVVIGTVTTPTAKLHVGGDIRATGSIYATYQDLAEWVPAKQQLTPGTVVVLDPAEVNHVMSSTRSYDTTVAGVVSERPGILLGVPADNKAAVATTGRVKVRVDATKGAIAVGDLLVTSDKPGTAMKSTAVEVSGIQMHRPGTVIGKALEPLASGEGEILVLLSLQ